MIRKLLIMMVLLVSIVCNGTIDVNASGINEELFLKTKENSQKDISLRRKFLEDLNKKQKKIEKEAFKKIKDDNRNSKAISKNLTVQKNEDNILKFPEVEINGKIIKLYPESTETREEILMKNKDFYKELKKEIENNMGRTFSDDDFVKQETIDYMLISYLGSDNINMNREDVVQFFDKLTLANNVEENNNTLELIYSNNLEQFDEYVTSPVNTKEESTFRETVKNSNSYNRWNAANYALS